MSKYMILVSILILVLGCTTVEETPKTWQYTQTIPIKGINAIGMQLDTTTGNIWLSDGDHNRLVAINKEGHIIKTIPGFERPMHIAIQDGQLYVPEYGNDGISLIKGETRSQLPLKDSLDAPAGIAVYGQEIAIADFYNHSILYTADGENYERIGSQGHNDGQFYYPTDVQITPNHIWVADAYNHRVQQLNKQGEVTRVIGWDQGMNAATGILVHEETLFVTDFENSRVFVFDLEGNLKQELTTAIDKPTEMLVIKDTLYITNYRKAELVHYQLQPEPKPISG